MEIRLLGPLEVLRDGAPVSLGGPKVRGLLARLALSPNCSLSDARLIDALWELDLPDNPHKVLQNCILRLRKAVGNDLVRREPGGYALVADSAQIDLARAEELFEQGRSSQRSGAVGDALSCFDQALTCWRGVPLQDLESVPFVPAEVTRIEELRMSIEEARLDARLDLGQHADLVGELARLTAEHPLRERLWAQRMIALYRSGRQQDALRAYQDVRGLLDEQLGLAPSRELAELERAILTQSLEQPPKRRSLPTGTVTFLMTDVESSTQLLHELGDEYAPAQELHNAALRRALNDNAGTEVATTGDGLLVVFEDPRRAVAAAVDAQRLLDACEWPRGRPLRARIGIHVGLATPTTDGKNYVSIAVNEVARVCDAGHGGQILLSGDAVQMLGGHAAPPLELIPLGKYQLKGFQDPVQLHQVVWPAGRREFPALRSASAGDNLPPQRTQFVGRERELAELERLLEEHHLITLVGPGGVGKTRTMLEVAQRRRSAYVDGAWFVRLGAIQDPDLVPAAIAEAVGVSEQPQQPIFETVIQRLQDASLLLLLDNCEHVIDVAAELVEELLSACPAVKVIATSREALALPDEAVFALMPLPLPGPSRTSADAAFTESDAVRLFADRARRARREFRLEPDTASHVAELCRLLDGLPLAIELVAPLVRQLPLAELVRRTRAEVLGTGGGRGRDARHATVRAAIDWGYRLLDPVARDVFDRLGVFAGGFTPQAAEAVCGECGMAGDSVLEPLAQLVEKSLVFFEERHGAPRYRMLGTIRQFARDRLRERPDCDAAWLAHWRVCLELARRLDDGAADVAVLDELDAEQDNIRAVLAWAETALEREDALAELAVALIPFWRVRAQLTEGRRWLAGAAERTRDPRLAAAATLGQGWFALTQGDYEEAEQLLEAAQRELRGGDLHGEAKALHALGQVKFYKGDFRAAVECFQASLDSFGGLADEGGLAAVHHDYGRAARFRGDYALAEEHLQRSLWICERIGDRIGTAQALHELGRVARRLGDAGTATEHLERSLEIYTQLGDRRGIAKSNYALGSLAFEQGQHATARERFTASVASFREVGDPQGFAWPLRGLARVAALEGDLATARALLQEVLAVGRSMNSPAVVMSALWGLGDLAEASGEVLEGVAMLREAADLAEQIGYGPEVARIRQRILELTQS